MTAAFLHEFMPYGAPELQDAERRHLVRGLALGSLLASLLFAVAWSLSLVLVHHASPEPNVIISPFTVDPDFHVLEPPPPIAQVPIAQPSVSTPEVGVPQPAQDTPLNLENTLALPGETHGPPEAGESGGREAPPLPPPTRVGPVNERGTPFFVDEIPAPVREVKPEYPDIAKQAGVEGLVIVDVLVGTNGRVVEAQIDPRINVLMLNESALKAARQWVFTPAIQRGQPVMVWMKLPFHYTLHQ